MLKAITIGVFLSILSATQSAAFGQTDPPPAGLRTLPHDFARDEWKLWSSPFRKSSYDSKTVKKYVIPFGVICAALIATDSKTGDLLPNTTDQTRWSGRVSQAGAGYTAVGFSGTAYLLGKAFHNDHLAESGLLALEAVAHAQVVVFAIKQISNRRRPADGGGGGFWNGGNAFMSGHAATSFAIASVFAYEYRHHIAVPIVAYTLASAVAASRVSAQRHWLSDVFAGGTTGFILGRFVYKNHHNRSLPGSPVGSLMPRVGFTGRSVALNWVF